MADLHVLGDLDLRGRRRHFSGAQPNEGKMFARRGVAALARLGCRPSRMPRNHLKSAGFYRYPQLLSQAHRVLLS
jgi:hypothetical protein